MIIKLLCSPLFVLASTIVSILPMSNAQSQITSVFGMLSIAFQFLFLENPQIVWGFGKASAMSRQKTPFNI